MYVRIIRVCDLCVAFYHVLMKGSGKLRPPFHLLLLYNYLLAQSMDGVMKSVISFKPTKELQMKD